MKPLQTRNFHLNFRPFGLTPIWDRKEKAMKREILLAAATTLLLLSTLASEVFPQQPPGTMLRPRAFLDEYISCLDTACTSAGGIWSDTEGDCLIPPGATKKEIAAMAAAYLINSQACWWSTVGGTFFGWLARSAPIGQEPGQPIAPWVVREGEAILTPQE